MEIGVVLAIVLIVLFSAISAALAGYYAYGRGRQLGQQAEMERQARLVEDALGRGQQQPAG